MRLLAILLLMTGRLVADCNCTTQNMTYTSYISVCASGCSSTTVANAITQAANAAVCFCLKGDASSAGTVSVTRTTAYTWLFTGDIPTAVGPPRSIINTGTGNTIGVSGMTAGGQILEFSNIRLLNTSATYGITNSLFTISSASSNGMLYITDAIIESQQPNVGASGSNGYLVNAANLNAAGGRIIFDRSTFRRSAPEGSTHSAGIISHNATLAAGLTITVKNCLVDAKGTTGPAVALFTFSATGLIEYFNDTFVNASISAAVFGSGGTTIKPLVVKNCAFYNPVSDQKEFKSNLTTSSLAQLTVTSCAFTGLTAFAGTGNIFGVTAAAFMDHPNGNYTLPGANTVLWNKGEDLTANGVTTDLLNVARPQSRAYDIGCYEQPSGVRAVPTAVLRAVPTASLRAQPTASLRAVPTTNIRLVP